MKDSVRVVRTFAKDMASMHTSRVEKTIKDELVVPKDKNHITKKSGII